MKIVLLEQSMIYDITIEDKFYTLYVSEQRQGVCQYELVDEDGNIVNDDDLMENIIEEVNDLPTLGF